jgi:hypothetical protein
MNIRLTILLLILVAMKSCLNIEEDPIILIQPTAEISAHIKNQKIYATALVNVNPQVLSVGNIPSVFEFSGNLSIYDTNTGNPIDVNAFSGGGLSQAYSVTADTTNRRRFIVIASGTVNAYADIGNDGKSDNDKLISTGDFYREDQFIVSELVIK